MGCAYWCNYTSNPKTPGAHKKYSNENITRIKIMNAISSSRYGYPNNDSDSNACLPSFGLFTISENQPSRKEHYNSCSSIHRSLSRTKSYKMDLSSLVSSSGEQSMKSSDDINFDAAVSWGYYVDAVNQS
jgi:hypothetical protein